jgi:peptidoglycan-N-acetylglucosamine deacetylase
MRFCLMFWVVFLVCVHGHSAAEVVTQLPGAEKVIALTFDACETKTPSFLDEQIVSFLLNESIPFTIFVSGKFARRNAKELRSLSGTGLVELENHSLNHSQHMERLGDDAVMREVVECEGLIAGIGGRKPLFFRFPAGNYDQKTLRIVEGLGYRVVHWSFASGDPDRSLSPQRLSAWVLGKARPGNILIFHINGRGYSTGEALPAIVEQLRRRGYRFVRLDAVLAAPGDTEKPAGTPSAP